ncbi:MAG: hypothetical protein WCE68_08480 [Anaerolineales bacterium]
MKFRILSTVLILLIITACNGRNAGIYGTSSPVQIPTPMISNPQNSPSKVPSEEAFLSTELFTRTAEAETQVGVDPYDATMTVIVATKFALNTESYSTETALPTETPFPSIPPPNTPACKPGNLKAIPYGNMGAGGNIEMSGAVANISTTACYLQAWPFYSLVDATGKPLDVLYSPNDERYGYSVFPAGQQAWFAISWGNWCGGDVVGGVFIRIFLPAQSGSIDIPPGGGPNPPVNGGGRCDDPGQKSYVETVTGYQYVTNQP